MTSRRNNRQNVRRPFYTGQSRKAATAKPAKERQSVDPELVRRGLEQLAEQTAKVAPPDRWGGRDRSVPANKWSGKP